MAALIHLPVPIGWDHAQDYENVLGRGVRTSIFGNMAVLVGSYLNAYIISKLKILTRGRNFILRSIGSSAVGELIQTVVGCLLVYTGVFPFHTILKLMIDLYVVQITLGVIISSVGSILVRILKHVEGDYYDTVVNFNPFAHQKVDPN